MGGRNIASRVGCASAESWASEGQTFLPDEHALFSTNHCGVVRRRSPSKPSALPPLSIEPAPGPFPLAIAAQARSGGANNQQSSPVARWTSCCRLTIIAHENFMRRHTNSILAVLIVLASAMPVMSSMRGLVLCISTDGRIEIEMQHVTPGCIAVCGVSSPSDGAGNNAGLLGGRASHGHSCSDLSLGDFDFRTERLRQVSPCLSFDLSFAQVITVAWFDVSSLDCIRSTSQREGAPGAVARLSERCALRSVILRI